MECDSIQDEALGHKLGVNVLITQELAHIQPLLGEDVSLDLACPQAACARRGDVDEFGASLHAVVHTALGTADVNVLDFSSFAKVLNDGGAVKDGIHLQAFAEITGHVAKDDVQALAEQVGERVVKIVEQQRLQSALGSLEGLTAHEAVDILSIGVDELAQDVDSQVTCSARHEYVAQFLAFALAEALQHVALQQVVDGGVVKCCDFGVALVDTLAGN